MEWRGADSMEEGEREEEAVMSPRRALLIEARLEEGGGGGAEGDDVLLPVETLVLRSVPSAVLARAMEGASAESAQGKK